ncbi:hypothetical protein KBX37_19130 [Micromonospora sp. U56]|uniref:hypothetical protein n=1 Tax=Micromonospora sp. U56 TaxID=2824900 RepID=UPI001B396A20|nr:hypothetical protein [Micromonospora sp. U56]MBQ0895190.1 hypothetical protein [Micromonospora sp. U56]
MVGFRGEQSNSNDWIIKAVRDGLGGVILFDQDLETKSVRNIRSPHQVTGGRDPHVIQAKICPARRMLVVLVEPADNHRRMTRCHVHEVTPTPGTGRAIVDGLPKGVLPGVPATKAPFTARLLSPTRPSSTRRGLRCST